MKAVVRHVARLGAVAIGLVALRAVPAAAGVAVGSAQIIHGDGSALRSGGSQTTFSVALPQGARCPGDSTKSPWYRAYSFMVPKGVDPASITFKGGYPDKGLGFINGGAYYGAINVARDTGQVIEIPTDFSIGRFSAADVLPNGANTATWSVGLACATNAGDLSNYWGTDMTFTAARSDPHGFTWTSARSGVSSGKSSSLSTGPLIVVGALAAALAALALRRRRSSAARAG